MCGQLSFLGKPVSTEFPSAYRWFCQCYPVIYLWKVIPGFQRIGVANLLLLLFCLSLLFSTDQIQQKRVTSSKSMRVHGGFLEKIFEKKLKKGSPLESLGKMIWTSTFWCPELHKRKKPAWPLTTLSMKRVFFWRQIS